MPLIETTLASWRRLPLSLVSSPKVASFSHGRSSFVAAFVPRIRSRNPSSDMSRAVSVAAFLLRKKVVRMTLTSAFTGTPFVSVRA